LFRKYGIYFLLLLLSAFILTNENFAQESSPLYKWLKSIPDIEVKQVKQDSIFAEAYEIIVTQPIDHDNPNGQKFRQQIYLSFTDKEKPVVIDLDGYAVRNRTTELSRLLNCNQVIVEHRYYGESVPSPFDWQYLTIKQAAEDQHRIIEMLKDFFTGKWISTGISKGGSCVIFHRYFFPDDVDVSVPYVGPLNYSEEDQRVYEWIESTVSTPECRQRVNDFQTLCFKKRDELFSLFKQNAEEKELTYNIVGIEKAYEYSVLEYSFAYWQWSDGDCSKIPDENSSIQEIWDHLLINGGVSYFSDADIIEGYPFFYQCYTEYGYYGYKIDAFKDYIKYADGHTRFFIPKDANPVYDPRLLNDINNWASNEAKNFIFINGGNDPWTSPSACINGKTNSIKMVLPNGSHRSRIKGFEKKDKELIYSKLEEWLGSSINR